jgi:hypothetical protein
MDIFYYPWAGFRREFLAKDVGLLPIYNSKECEVLLLQSSEKLTYKYRNIIVDAISRFYLIGLMQLCYLVLKTKPKIFYTFHIGLKNLIPIIFVKLCIPSCKIICKGDVNMRTADYLIDKPNGLLNRFRIYYYYFMFKNIDIITVETSDVFNLLSRKFMSEGLDNLHFLPNGLDDAEFKGLILPNLKSNIVTVVTRFSCEDKAPERIFSIIKNLKNKNLQLVLVGEIPLESRKTISLMANDYDVNLKIEGVLSRSEIIDLLSRSKFFVCYSKVESFCISLIEAAALGNIVITTKVGVAEDLAFYYKYIHVLDDFNAEAYCSILLTDDISLIKEDLYECAKEVRGRYCWSKLIKEIS